jgi:hypothetical protein
VDGGCTARVEASALPVSMRGYDAVDDVVWLDGTPPVLSLGQRSALVRWRTNHRRLTTEIYTTPPQLVWKGMGSSAPSRPTLLAGLVIVVAMCGAGVVWWRRPTRVTTGPLALAAATVLGVVAASVTGRAGAASGVVVHHATTVQQVGDGSMMFLRGTVEYPTRDTYALTLDARDGDVWFRSSRGLDISIDHDGAAVLDAASPRGGLRDIDLEAVTDDAPFDVRRDGGRIHVTNVSDTTLADCAFGERRSGGGQPLMPGASLDTAEPSVREAPFFSCRTGAPPIALTDQRHTVTFDGESLVVVWLPVDRAVEPGP